MKNTFFYIGILLSVVVVSCKEEVTKPKVSYDSNSKKVEQVVIDTTRILIADLPIQFENTSVLIHPIGEVVPSKSSKSSYSTYEKDGFTISNSSENEITGYLTNFKFQETPSDSLRVLTDKAVLIERATYLKSVANSTKNQIMVYVLADMDTNKDGKVDGNDIKALYFSNLNGTNFTKITQDFQELIDWRLIESKNKLYFRTIEDTNKNGAFDNSDFIHYHYVDLSKKEWKAEEYKPL